MKILIANKKKIFSIREFCDTTFLFELYEESIVRQSISLGVLKQSFLYLRAYVSTLNGKEYSIKLDFSNVDDICLDMGRMARASVEEAMLRLKKEKDQILKESTFK